MISTQIALDDVLNLKMGETPIKDLRIIELVVQNCNSKFRGILPLNVTNERFRIKGEDVLRYLEIVEWLPRDVLFKVESDNNLVRLTYHDKERQYRKQPYYTITISED